MHIEIKEMQSTLEKSQIESRLEDLDEFESEYKLKEYLESLSLSELIEIYYIQLCEISRIRNMILNSVKDNDTKISKKIKRDLIK